MEQGAIGLTLADLIGLVGVAMLIGAFFLLQCEKVKFDDYLYLGFNSGGSALIAVSLLGEFNMSAFIIEVAWAAVSLFGLYRRWRRSPL